MPQQRTPVKVFLADDSDLIRDRIAALLVSNEMLVVGQAETPKDSINAILAVHPDVVVLDARLEGGSGLQVLRVVRQAAPDIAFVVFTNNANAVYRKRYLGEGAAEFLDKSSEFERLVSAVAKASQRAAH
jgi:DNA-binding NarL/FixJ family response regulator